MRELPYFYPERCIIEDIFFYLCVCIYIILIAFYNVMYVKILNGTFN